jgi:hypothetical protein
MSLGGEVKVEIVALLAKYIVYESYINATGCLNTILLLKVHHLKKKYHVKFYIQWNAHLIFLDLILFFI